MTTTTVIDARSDMTARVRAAIATVHDPEYPDVSIVDLGLLESIEVNDTTVTVGLIPTFSGCPALRMIADDVRDAVTTALAEAASTTDTAMTRDMACTVEWLTSPIWTTDRISPTATDRLAADYTVVLRRKDGTLRCPVCGSDAVTDQSLAGPTRCRSIAWCDMCRNPVEVMR